jgi:dUTP pyrophosphatase
MKEQSLSDKTMREMYPGIPSKHSFIPTVSVYRREEPFISGVLTRPDIPERKTTEAYCYDICAFTPGTQIELKPLTVVRVPTGLYLALPEHWAALVCSRSGLASQGVQVINAPGVIDADYRDEVCVLLSYIAPPDSPPFVIEDGMRIAQLLYLPPTPTLTTQEVPSRLDLPKRDTTRTGGFGSTGV